MDLKDYFATHNKGTGVLSTADARGVVDAALYARPHVLDEGLGFVMPDRRTHRNLGENPNAAYLFVEEPSEGGNRYVGKRLYLRKISEEQDTDRVRSLRRRTNDEDKPGRFLVLFEVTEIRPLVGDEPG